MKFCLICSDLNRKKIIEILNFRNVLLDNKSDYFLVEKGFTVPDAGISVIFDPNFENNLSAFLNEFVVSESSWMDKETVVGKKDDSFEIIQLTDISHFEADNNDTFCVAKSKKYEIKKKLYELENAFSSKGFVRVNKSFVVNILKVNEIIPWFGGRLLLKMKDSDAEIEVSRSNVSFFKKYIDM